jgi:hypothetical protein
MKKLQEIDLKQACSVFAVANTPLFLLRKLRQDASVLEISRSFSGEEILGHLRDLISREPETMLDHTLPYVCLVALALKDDDRDLKRAMTIPAPTKWNWFDYIRKVLVETYTPTTHTTLWVPGQAESYPISTGGGSVTQKRILVSE